MAAAIVIAASGSATAIAKADVPSAVLQAFANGYPNVKATGYDKESDNGKTHFEISSKLGRYEQCYIYLEDGTLEQIETGIAPESLPKIVTDAAKAAHADCQIVEAERITRGTTTEYEVVIKSGKIERELLVSADGKILEPDAADEDDENDGESEE